MYSTFCAALSSSSPVDATSLSSWNVDVLVDSIKQLAPDTDWVSVKGLSIQLIAGSHFHSMLFVVLCGRTLIASCPSCDVSAPAHIRLRTQLVCTDIITSSRKLYMLVCPPLTLRQREDAPCSAMDSLAWGRWLYRCLFSE